MPSPDHHDLDPRTWAHLGLYGREAESVLAGGTEVVCEHTGAVAGEIAHAARNELAVTLSDVLMRRTGIAWGACRGLCCDERVAAMLDWSEVRRRDEVEAFRRDVAWHLPSLDDIAIAEERTAAAASTGPGA